MNDICNVSDIFFSIMYADDTSLVVNGKDLSALLQLLKTERFMYMVQSKQTFIENHQKFLYDLS